MKKNKVIVISLIIAIIIIGTIFITKSNKNQSHKISNKTIESSDINITNNISENKNTNNQSNVASKNNRKVIDTEGTNVEFENIENYKIMYPDGRLFITFENKVYLPSTAVQEFNFDFPRTPTNNYLKLIREYFNKLWDTLECDIITVKENDYDAAAKLQFSKYEVPIHNLTFYLSSTLDFYEGGTHIIDDPLIYTEYFSNYMYVRIANSNIGRSIHAFKINNTWYAYKLNVIE